MSSNNNELVEKNNEIKKFEQLINDANIYLDKLNKYNSTKNSKINPKTSSSSELTKKNTINNEEKIASYQKHCLESIIPDLYRSAYAFRDFHEPKASYHILPFFKKHIGQWFSLESKDLKIIKNTNDLYETVKNIPAFINSYKQNIAEIKSPSNIYIYLQRTLPFLAAITATLGILLLMNIHVCLLLQTTLFIATVLYLPISMLISAIMYKFKYDNLNKYNNEISNLSEVNTQNNEMSDVSLNNDEKQTILFQISQ